jgi:hypothetical protein
MRFAQYHAVVEPDVVNRTVRQSAYLFACLTEVAHTPRHPKSRQRLCYTGSL